MTELRFFSSFYHNQTLPYNKCLGVSKKCWNSLRYKLKSVLSEPKIPLNNRWKAGNLLSFLQDPRFEENELVPQTILIPGGSFIMGTEQNELNALIQEVKKVELSSDR